MRLTDKSSLCEELLYCPLLFFNRLRDTDNHVRRTTLLVLSRLILHDMVKVKGQISELACCITDGSAEISGLAKAFFLELSQKVIIHLRILCTGYF